MNMQMSLSVVHIKGPSVEMEGDTMGRGGTGGRRYHRRRYHWGDSSLRCCTCTLALLQFLPNILSVLFWVTGHCSVVRA